ncbi:MAG: AI-2E family transporter [Hydrococcus sp. C42_A2020_068]|uniref:AI-2E family transporter n=1 Tax=Pleurocapsa sp. PCC 7327 TaxID=118163 RepID=UPI00029FE8AF|nr:AI-2E family transporter [Pleurocapsa sp. PCC 7327]AFY75799.1 putative permease [Pleurocapsa sp. PCC 7327]MBF2020422.1 AI-2E family transporter [Hydrococcus sp. C42_A2020_068]
MVDSGLSKPQRNWLQNWWASLNPLSRLLAIALAAPLTVLNARAFSAIFGYFRSLIVILLLASVLAFLLNYPVNFLESRGVRREHAAILVFLLTLFIFLGLGLTLLPLAFSQAQQLVARLPEWLDSGQRQLMMLDERVQNLGLPISFDGLIAQINSRLAGELQSLAGKILNLALSLTVFTVVRSLDVLLTVILTFYLLLHSQDIWRSLIEWLPKSIQKPFTETLRLSFQNYFLAQIVSATLMASGLVSSFLLLKIPFGLLFGLTIGLMALIPFGGSVGIALVTLLVALQNIGSALQLLAVAVVVQQIVENGIAPRVLGSVTGLNPFWVLLALLTGARIGGLLGVIVAVPTAVMIKEALTIVRSTANGSQPHLSREEISQTHPDSETAIEEQSEETEIVKSR